jgi:hypothetical protein
MPIEIMEWYTREDLKANPDKLFVFGDNYLRSGWGGQTGACREEPNAQGICTKKSPGMNEKDFLTDKEYGHNITFIMRDLLPILSALDHDKIVVWPKDGIETGLAEMPARASATFLFLSTVVQSLKLVYGGVGG